MNIAPSPVRRSPEGAHPAAWPDAAGVGSGARCAACGRPRDPGALLTVSDLWGRRDDATVCRPSISPDCLAWAGPSHRTTLELMDPDAARRYDRAAGGRDPARHEMSETIRRARRAAEAAYGR